MFICGMLDLLAQLVGAFPDYVEVVDDSVVLALEIIKRSHKQAFRSKAVSFIYCLMDLGQLLTNRSSK